MIGFIGLGVMGRSMARHLRNAGHELVVYTRTRARADEIIALGAQWADTPADVARAADVVITMVGYPYDVEEMYFGDNGIIDHARQGALLIDMTTSTPRLAQRIAEAAHARGLDALDAPVSGGDIGAREARLTIMVGGSQSAFERARPLFEVMGKTIRLMGAPGAGQHTKMCNQIAIAAGMLGVCEALAYAQRAGLEQTEVIDTISTGAAASWSLSNYGPRIIKGDFAPGFYVKHFIKDMEIALQAATEMGLEAPGLELALRRYRELVAAGGAELGTQALYQLYDGRSD
ncbi:MAG TPA: NAD(P)-dependent oxidoreductase [Longimicrobiales bacterium]